ncbi:MAG: helix-turn-helix domain-containing protein, partial [Desulfosarcina sp.]
QILLDYGYPGNVRELENILEHALIICRGDMIQPDHLPEYVKAINAPVSAPETRNDSMGRHNQEHQRILAALQKTDGHRRLAARELGMERTTLWRRMKKYGIRG